jgi:hypothetical protein
MCKWQVHFKQWERTQLTPINEFWWVVEAEDEAGARNEIMTNIEKWSSINLINRVAHYAKVPDQSPYVPVVWKGVHTQIISVKRVRDASGN